MDDNSTDIWAKILSSAMSGIVGSGALPEKPDTVANAATLSLVELSHIYVGTTKDATKLHEYLGGLVHALHDTEDEVVRGLETMMRSQLWALLNPFMHKRESLNASKVGS